MDVYVYGHACTDICVYENVLYKQLWPLEKRAQMCVLVPVFTKYYCSGSWKEATGIQTGNLRRFNRTVYKDGGFADSSAGKESACNVGDPSLIPGLGRSPGEGIGYPLQCSWASLVAQLVKNPPAMRETWVRSLGWEDPLEKGKANHSSLLTRKIPRTVHGVAKSRTRLGDFHFTHFIKMEGIHKRKSSYQDCGLKGGIPELRESGWMETVV